MSANIHSGSGVFVLPFCYYTIIFLTCQYLAENFSFFGYFEQKGLLVIYVAPPAGGFFVSALKKKNVIYVSA